MVKVGDVVTVEAGGLCASKILVGRCPNCDGVHLLLMTEDEETVAQIILNEGEVRDVIGMLNQMLPKPQ